MISFETLSNFASIGLEKEVKVKSTHTDFGFLDDIDSIEDIVFNEMLLQSVDPASLYPHWEQLKDFSKYLGKQEISIVNEFPQYINKFFSYFSNLRGNELFNGNGNFQETRLTESIQDKVDLVIKNRQKYIANNQSIHSHFKEKNHTASCRHQGVTNKQKVYK